MNEVYIVCAKRTATGAFLSSLSTIHAYKLGALVIKSVLQEIAIDPSLIEEVILGQVITGGTGQNPARQTLIEAGIPKETPAFTINKVCGSGLKSVHLAYQSIALGESDLLIAGGQENMSLGMHASYIRAGNKLGNITSTDMMQYDGLTDFFSNNLMGVTAENIAKQFNVTREAQDEFAALSHQKALRARENRIFQDEIVPIEVQNKKQQIIFDQDESIRDTNIEILSKLKPVFVNGGSVTAGNSSPINDGAAIIVLASKQALKDHNLRPLARIVSFGEKGVDPSIMGTGPVPASKKALAKAGWSVQDLDLIECNEAFASQAIYVNREMNWDLGKVNVHGGAIALGHPIGASGARVLTSLVHQMKRSNATKALATLCIGGGMGIAVCIERAL